MIHSHFRSRTALERFVRPASVIGAALVAPLALGQANIVTNGGFELPVIGGSYAQRTSATPFGGWSVDPIGQGVAHVGTFGTPSAIEGSQSVELNFFSTGGIYQAIPTTPGNRYVISFLMAGQLNVGPDVKQIRVDLGGSTVGTASWSRAGTGGQWVRMTFAGTATSTLSALHFLGVTPANEDGGPYIDDVRVPCLAIEFQPFAVEICPGGTARLTVGPAGDGVLAVRWRKGGVPIDLAANPSAGTATLVIDNAQGTDDGMYDCVVSNGCDSLTSDAVRLTVCPADFNCDGALDFFDYDDFVIAFESGDPRADFDGDGTVDFFDYDAFVVAFETGC